MRTAYGVATPMPHTAYGIANTSHVNIMCDDTATPPYGVWRLASSERPAVNDTSSWRQWRPEWSSRRRRWQASRRFWRGWLENFAGCATFAHCTPPLAWPPLAAPPSLSELAVNVVDNYLHDSRKLQHTLCNKGMAFCRWSADALKTHQIGSD